MSIIDGIQQVLGQYGSIIESYRGNIPTAVVAAMIWHESSGNACPTPTACCDEQGLMQLWPWQRDKYGVSDACDPDQNIRGGCQHWLDDLQTMLNSIGQPASESDLWKFSWTHRAIGSGALPCIWKGAGQPADFATLVNWVNTGPLEQYSSCFGSQSAASIAKRVNDANTWVDTALGLGGTVEAGGLLAGALVAVGVWYLLKYFKK
jgi:hypothetical protein